MTLKQLEYAVTVAKYGNITEAATALFIAQPSLTHALNELEEEMNIKIFLRTNRGVSITNDGERFLGYARQVLEQANLLNDEFKNIKNRKTSFSVSCQHYTFCVNAFSDTIKEFESDSYDFTLRETQTHEIIDDVSNLKSEIGVLYLSNNNRDVLEKLLKKNDLAFNVLFEAKPHVFISKNNPLSKLDVITLEDLKPYPYLTFEQGEYNSFYFSEEFMSNIETSKNIMVRDRATLFNLCQKLNGYTVSSGVIYQDVNSTEIISKPFIYDEKMEIGYITKKNIPLSKYGISYIENIKKYLK